MKLVRCILLAVALRMTVSAQPTPSFDLHANKVFLSSTKDITSDQLRALHPAGLFQSKRPSAALPAYFDSICQRYSLTNYEKGLLAEHGFVVTSRLPKQTFMSAFIDVFNKDMPVFVSTDAILHAIHKSYDDILMDVERSRMINWLDSLLAQMHNQLPILDARYSTEPRMQQMLKDLDVYLTHPRQLLGKSISPYYIDNTPTIDSLQNFISTLQPQSLALFSQAVRTLDFSQFKVRGHYTQSPDLSKYFQAMMWLGRTEIYLIPP